jgi:hypothetical protein
MKPQYIVDDTGRKVSVVLSIKEYEKLMDELDEAYCCKLYDKASELNEPTVPLEEYLKSRKKSSPDEKI